MLTIMRFAFTFVDKKERSGSSTKQVTEYLLRVCRLLAWSLFNSMLSGIVVFTSLNTFEGAFIHCATGMCALDQSRSIGYHANKTKAERTIYRKVTSGVLSKEII
jgi:hypothetical protein